MKPIASSPSTGSLPVIYATNPDLIQQGDILAVADLQAALALLAERGRRPGSLLDISSIDVTKGYAMDVVDADKAHFIFAGGPGRPARPGAKAARQLPGHRYFRLNP